MVNPVHQNLQLVVIIQRQVAKVQMQFFMGHEQGLPWAFSQLVARKKHAFPESKRQLSLTEAENPGITFHSDAQAVQRL
jgi:hypothetical protein